jgi:hypothetical protein
MRQTVRNVRCEALRIAWSSMASGSSEAARAISSITLLSVSLGIQDTALTASRSSRTAGGNASRARKNTSVLTISSSARSRSRTAMPATLGTTDRLEVMASSGRTAPLNDHARGGPCEQLVTACAQCAPRACTEAPR